MPFSLQLSHLPRYLPGIAVACIALSSNACQAPAPSPQVFAEPENPPRRQLATGTILRLSAVEYTAATQHSQARPRPMPEDQCNALWHAALRQSPFFDVAAGLEDCQAEHEVGLQVDWSAGQCTSTLLQQGRAPVGLAAASIQGNNLPAALDQLAWRTRLALGEVTSVPPLPCAQAYSHSRNCIRLTNAGARQAMQGDLNDAIHSLRRALGKDPQCCITLLHLSAATRERGQPDQRAQVQEWAEQALTLQQRLGPSTRIRLQRNLALAQQDDTQLLQLAERMMQARPHDPHAIYTQALAWSLSGQTKPAIPLLRKLQQRWPKYGAIPYQLGCALLTEQQPEAALQLFETAKRQLPLHATTLPHAVALLHCGKHLELRRFLADLERDRGITGTAALHTIRRMQASHALLQQEAQSAITALLTDLEWLRQRPSRWDLYQADLAEAGEVLLALGQNSKLLHCLDGFMALDSASESVHETLQKLQKLCTASNEPIQIRPVQIRQAQFRNAQFRNAAAGKATTWSFDQRQQQKHPLMSPRRALHDYR